MGELRVTPTVAIPDAELAERFSRSSGPGGQSVNTADSRVELSWDVARSPSLNETIRRRLLSRLGHRLTDGVLTVVAAEHRSQLRNRQSARQRLALLVREAAAPPPPARRPTKPSHAAHERRLAGKRRRSEVKRGRSARYPPD